MSTPQRITLVVGMASNNVIGVNNTLPWHIPEDLKHFKAVTLGKPIIMGRKTWESLPFKPLPGRRNLVISRQADYIDASMAQTESHNSLAAALAACDEAEVCVMGGAQIYAQAMAVATDLQVTHIDLDIEGDAFFPDIDHDLWRVASLEKHVTDDGIRYAFVHYQRMA
ncbi:MAG: dihydrofolate reductase [Neisseriaceae bacterium]|nr:dihydrofolate reductase [Neisseriaceae bacterium]MBP6861955.1 dihydrofolate reductase [Neisseriaceae bacterium]